MSDQIGWGIVLVLGVMMVILSNIMISRSRKEKELPKYVVRHFDCDEDLQKFCNEMASSYRAISIGATNSDITVLLERK